MSSVQIETPLGLVVCRFRIDGKNPETSAELTRGCEILEESTAVALSGYGATRIAPYAY